MERIVITITHDSELTEEQLDTLGLDVQDLVPGGLLEDCYTEDVAS